MEQQINTPFKTKSKPFQASGVVFGRVDAVNGKLLNVTVPRLSGNAVYEEVEYLTSSFDTVPEVGEGVVLSFVEGRRDEMIVIGRLRSAMNFTELSISNPKDGQFLQWDGDSWTNAVLPTNEPTGFEDKTESVVSFTNGTRTFQISPAASSFTVWHKGLRYIKTAAESVSLPNTSGIYYIYYGDAGVLSYKTTYFDFENEAPVAYVYWNATDGVQYYFADERHGITLDWQTHEYLHRTRGAALASGLGISAYTLSGTGSADPDAKIDIGNGTFFDEDIEIAISHSATPVANSWQQRLQGGAYIPMYYLSGSGVWKKDVATQFPVKQGTARIAYNLNTAGTWTTPDASNNKFCVTWIAATNNLNEPVIGILGQQVFNTIGEAESHLWSEMTLTGFPVFEFRLLYQLVFQTATGYSNTPHARLVAATDMRLSSATGISLSSGAVELNDLTDVTIVAPSDERVLEYDDTTSQWIVGKRIAVGEIQPSSPREGDLWFDMSTNTVTSSVGRVYIQSTAPVTSEATYLWIQTFVGGGLTFWVEDGLT